MDPVTHTLVGASLASTALGRKTALAMPTLIIGANLPDVDVLSYALGGDQALAFRRGWTHGILALAILPVVLAIAFCLIARLRRSKRSDPPVDSRWLVMLSFLAVWSHPCLDWLNTYGMRWLMPFRGTWFYGDSTFIVEPWLWLILAGTLLLGRQASGPKLLAWLLPAALLLLILGRSGPQYVPLLLLVFALLLVAHLWRPPQRLEQRQRIAALGLTTALAFIGLQISIHAATVDRVVTELEARGLGTANELMVGPKPANPLQWDIVVGDGDSYRFGTFAWTSEHPLSLSQVELPALRSSPLWDEIHRSGQLEGYLDWIRFPWFEIEESGGNRLVHVMDARYRRSRASGFGGGTIRLAPAD